MFNNPRYVTQGIIADVPLHLQIILWNMVDTMTIDSKDYLQVFRLSNDNGAQKIVHTQEVPEYEKVLILKSESPITTKIFAIDDTDHSTMLLASEY